MHLLKATLPTVIKQHTGREPGFESFNLKPEDLPLLVQRMELDPERDNFYKIELVVPQNGLFSWFAFAQHVEKQDAPNNWVISTASTVVKRRPVDSEQLKDNEKFNLLIGAQPLLANWVRQTGNYIEVELTEPHNGFRNWFVFSEHVEVAGKPLLVSTS